MRRLGLFIALAASLLGACAGPSAQRRRDTVLLEDELAELRAELRRGRRRIAELETENVVLRDKVDTAEVAAGASGVPSLPVEVLGPDEAPAPADPDGERIVAVTDDGTEIVYVGDAAAGRGVEVPDDIDLVFADELDNTPDEDDAPPRAAKASPPRTADDDDDGEAAPPRRARRPGRTSARPAKRTADAAPATSTDADAVAAYDAAVAQVKAKDHDRAIVALRAFLADHARHDLADNAQYWLGEVYYDTKDWARAIVEFRAVVEHYPRGNKVPDALLKLGYCFERTGQRAKARAALEQVIETYPKSQPAALAAAKLEELAR